MLSIKTLCLATLPVLASLVAAEPIKYVSVVSHAEKDCTGDALIATFDSSGGPSHCFQSAGKSFQYLKALDSACGRGYLTAYANEECDAGSNGDNFLYQNSVGGDAQACHNIVEGYGSFTLGCVA